MPTKKHSVMKKKSTFSKVLLILAIDFTLRLVFSCVPTRPVEIDFNYNKINVTGIDNSGQYLNPNNAIDTMYANALALKLTLSDSLQYGVYASRNIMQELFSFQSSYAMTVPENYIPQNSVESIHIKTLLDINNDIRAGDDITDYFLYVSYDNYTYGLYQDLDKGIDKLNSIQSAPRCDLVLVLRKSVQNTNVRFEVSVALDNGDTLSYTTELFNIIEP